MPECRNGLCQDIPSADEISIAYVIAGDTSEHLSLAVAPVLLTTCGACPGGASRIDSDRPHTVLRRQTFNPLSHLPICPRGGGFAEVLASRFGFAFLQADQVFEANGLKAIPGQLFNSAINVTVTCDSSAPFAFTAGPAPADFGTDCFPIAADGFFLARSNQLVHTYVNADDIATFALFRFSAFDPNDERFFGQRAALDDPCTRHRQPFVNDGSLASWKW